MGKKKKNKQRHASPTAVKNSAERENSAPQAPENTVDENASLPAPETVPEVLNRNEPGQTLLSADQPAAEESTLRREEQSTSSLIREKISRDIQVKSRLRRMLPDIIRVLLAFSVIGFGTAIWWKPPLLSASFPVTTFNYKNQPAREAALYRPLAMPERYYVKLPEKLENRYEWFAIDRRRETVALTEAPQHSFFGKTAIRRGEDLGLDLEFRDIDGHEWLIYFYADAIVFSNNLLSVRLDTRTP